MSEYSPSLTISEKFISKSPQKPFGVKTQKPLKKNYRIEIEGSKSAPKYKPKKVVKNFNPKMNNTPSNASRSNNSSLFTFNKASKKSRDSRLDISADLQKSSNFTKMNDIQKQTSEAIKSKKEYQIKINTIKNRINAIKKQEQDLNKKMDKIKKHERKSEIVKNDKIELAKKILKIERGKQNEIANKKVKAQNIRIKMYRGIEKSADKVLKKKNKDFQIKKEERIKLEDIKKQIKNDKIEKNIKKRIKQNEEVERVKAEEEIFELLKEEEKINQLAYVQTLAQKDADNLKNYLEKLEKEEENCMQSLRTTQIIAQKKIEQSSGFISPCRRSIQRNCKTPVNFGRRLNSISDLDSNQIRFKF